MKLFIAVVDERVIHDFVLRSFHNQRTKLHSNQIWYKLCVGIGFGGDGDVLRRDTINPYMWNM